LLCSGLSAAAIPPTITVGQLTLVLCLPENAGYCGEIKRPIDPTGAVPGDIKVGFEYFPHTDTSQPALGTILPQEGGPGYSSTGSRDFYLSIFDALRNRRDILIIDKRGTGLSDPIDCPSLQTGSVALSAVKACADQLGATAWYYGTAFAAGDIVAVLDALNIDQVDSYGDSYGTFFGQVLAGLHPKRLRSIILDSAYPVRAPDPWFAADWAKAWSAIELTCRRSPSCEALGGSAQDRVNLLADVVRTKPISGEAANGYGVITPATVDTNELMFIIYSDGYGPDIYRELDAAARAWLADGDAQPIVRLATETNTNGFGTVEEFSYGLAEAVTCSDYPLLYDLRAPLAVRSDQYQIALIRAREFRPDLFAPFSIDQGLAAQLYITPLDQCLPWPQPPNGINPGQPLPAGAKFPPVPTLVLSGDIDSITSVTDAQEVTVQFPDAIHLIVPNLGHVVAGSDEIGCTLSIVQHFVTDLAPGNIQCIPKVRPIRTVPKFALMAQSLAPVDPLPGNQATDAQRRIAAAGLEAVGDVLARWYTYYGARGRGLRGGVFSYASTATGYEFTLDQIAFTTDVDATGTMTWNTDTAQITATVALRSGGKAAGVLNIVWDDADINAIATITGGIQGAVLAAQRIAP
jgi:pimeloyl-ACP methyl ester carboxylesterase